VRRGHVQAQLLDEAGQAGRLAFRKVQHEPGQGRGVDDRVGERAFETAPDEPGVERVVTVLDEDRSVGEPQERAPGVLELRRSDQHRPVDVVAPARVGVDRSSAVDQRVEEGQRAGQLESLGPHLEHQEWRVAGRLDVQGDELRLVELCRVADFGRVDGDLLPGHRLRGAPRFEPERLGAHRATAIARRAQSISSLVTPRSSRTATA
jgi:hypothetical protein